MYLFHKSHNTMDCHFIVHIHIARFKTGTFHTTSQDFEVLQLSKVAAQITKMERDGLEDREQNFGIRTN